MPSASSSSRSSLPVLAKGEQPWMHGAAGVLGGSAAMMLFYPLDFLRTRMHTLHQGSRTMPLRSAGEIVRQEGLRGMYKGIGVSVVSHSLGWGLYLLTFRSAQQHVTELLGDRLSNSVLEASGRDFLSACIAATITGTVITPLHVLKTRRQLFDGQRMVNGKPAQPLPSGLGGVRAIVQREGWTAMFRGLGPQIVLTSNTTIQVTIYEWFRRNCFTNHEDPSPLQVALASAFSKAVACCVFNPLEVVRTRLQDQRNHGSREYASMWVGLQTIWRSEGLLGMYRGLPVNVARVIPSTVMAFVLYEKCLWAIRTTSQVARSSLQGTSCSNTGGVADNNGGTSAEPQFQ
ncbi:putative mitochondrial mitochondrial carrier protein [Leptomonas pyrrhocoris]|uniref:Putative mitochondrial mitochondrial carrier protein n=1 Tax=Leptomonas pyrrhocoris TaxID=157538 RepID=A0A0M9GAV9_LEPPY|nr:putative mitochondrial mitochondrial carrier protein [Leptomonas pyrrhocoris]XP_015664818.1 putative mitochondrial mitochondrial carrier protein [Leptomonas pyrrhocoris]XP_015664819.1 putative mitochondrial mitochondrial carrier protein [Leptomonas pyrrhocoris]XP_015664820.1 putative mitochondrial mitochondrial carrier protein [Leptomonas pyrrhocoris]KPA86378.1 putative mitochondrial mitochondrial carrier protein [Leptomonas pyrrhocoris]KPA86379.1 putative mitochondrial mitochondrial carrie|eukprot:XP_015664817.1 putative mitochondrial mitochondrial carrier protein [Leptomonas pyrrhocoris]